MLPNSHPWFPPFPFQILRIQSSTVLPRLRPLTLRAAKDENLSLNHSNGAMTLNPEMSIRPDVWAIRATL